MRQFWTKKELSLVRTFYPYVPTVEIAEYLGRKSGAVYQAAAKMRLHKCAEYLSSSASGRLQGSNAAGRAHRFAAGHVPANKGLRRPGWAPGRMSETQFRKGAKPHTWRPVGHERLTKEGYLQRKVADTGNTVADYVEVHRLLWEEAHGPIPVGLALVFKDGDRTHIELGNLELLSRADLMRRNTIHKLPKALVNVIMLNGALKRKIRETHEKQDVRSA